MLLLALILNNVSTQIDYNFLLVLFIIFFLIWQHCNKTNIRLSSTKYDNFALLLWPSPEQIYSLKNVLFKNISASIFSLTNICEINVHIWTKLNSNCKQICSSHLAYSDVFSVNGGWLFAFYYSPHSLSKQRRHVTNRTVSPSTSPHVYYTSHRWELFPSP